MTSALLLSVSGCKKGETTSSGGSSTTSAGGQGGEGGSGASGATGGSGGAVCHPEKEICDSKDNDCNGVADDVQDLPGGCHCNDGDMQTCYSGPDGTMDVGACTKGTQACVNGAWGECTGQVKPANETCNSVDDDCNGTVDDLGVATCGIGACAVALQKCVNGVAQQCVPGQPTTEVCDGADNDCDGKVDESDPKNGSNCLTGLFAECEVGVYNCLGGEPVCVPNVKPTDETCDGVDNDCDGTVDNNVPDTGMACTTNLSGPCVPGTIQCANAVIDCVPDVAPVPEVCDDNIDNDCNGVVDDIPGLNGTCDTGLLGACKDGTLVCDNGATTCMQTTFAEANDPCDGIDNDCDGVTDPGCLYSFTGVGTDVPISQLLGWTQCYIDTYGNSGTSLSSILTACNKAKLMLGCRLTGASTLKVVAWAPRVDVTFDTGTGNVLHNANGVGWYYNSSYSWGFAPQGDPVTRNSCDTTASSFDGFSGPDPTKRICWHTGGNTINSGWRCGNADSLSGSNYERIVYHAD